MVGVWTVRGGWSINCVRKRTHLKTLSTEKYHWATTQLWLCDINPVLTDSQDKVSQEEQARTRNSTRWEGRMEVSQLVWCSAVFLFDCVGGWGCKQDTVNNDELEQTKFTLIWGLLLTSSFSFLLLYCCFLHFSIIDLSAIYRGWSQSQYCELYWVMS